MSGHMNLRVFRMPGLFLQGHLRTITNAEYIRHWNMPLQMNLPTNGEMGINGGDEHSKISAKNGNKMPGPDQHTPQFFIN